MKTEEHAKGNIKLKLLIGLSAVILIVFMFPKGESIESEVTVGSIWIHDDLIAPFSFPVLKDQKIYQQELQDAAKSVFPVYIKQPQSIDEIIDSVKNYDSFLLKIIDSTLTTSGIENLNPTFLSTPSFNTFQGLRQQERNMLQRRGLKDILLSINGILSDVYKTGIINQMPAGGKDSIAVRTGNIDRIESAAKFLSTSQAETIVQTGIEKLNYSQDVKNALEEYALHFVNPNLIYSHSLHRKKLNRPKVMFQNTLVL